MKNTFRILILAIIVSVSSCKFLEVEPVSSITSGNFYKTANDAEAALTACYDGLQSYVLSRDVHLVSGILADELQALRGGNFTRHEAFNPNLDQGNINDFWRISYQTISRCMDVIENVPSISDPALNKDRVLGEAHFIKALQYFHLVRYFGPIPLLESTTKTPNQELKLARSEVSTVYEEIIADLLEAEKRLPVTNGNKARAAKGAATAMLVRVYLHRLAPGDYEKALSKAEEVMAGNQYQLVSAGNYGEMFSAGNAVETIFEVSNAPSVAVEGNSAFDVELVPAPGNSFRIVPEPKIIKAYSQDDIRKNVSLDRFNNRDYVKKYQAGAPDVTPRRLVDVPVPIIRLADVILMRAEALNELGRTQEAIPFVNQVRQRAGLQPITASTQAEVRKAIEDERYLELAFEGTRWFDLVRWGKVMETIPNIPSADRILWPIPVREIDLNPNLLPQNPGY